MPIARTPWIDDDGSGTTGTVINNAEKTLLYNQIDAALVAGGASAVTLFTPTDASGAALAFTLTQGAWLTVGSLVVAVYNVVWPATSNAAQAFLNLPVAAGPAITQGGYMAYTDVGSAITAYIPASGTKVGFAATSGGVFSNVMLTSKTIHMVVIYFR